MEGPTQLDVVWLGEEKENFMTRIACVWSPRNASAARIAAFLIWLLFLIPQADAQSLRVPWSGYAHDPQQRSLPSHHSR